MKTCKNKTKQKNKTNLAAQTCSSHFLLLIHVTVMGGGAYFSCHRWEDARQSVTMNFFLKIMTFVILFPSFEISCTKLLSSLYVKSTRRRLLLWFGADILLKVNISFASMKYVHFTVQQGADLRFTISKKSRREETEEQKVFIKKR